MSEIESNIDIPAEHERNIFGQFDAYLKKIERALDVTVLSRNGTVKLIGSPENVKQAQAVFELVSGKAEPSGLLPVQMPANMETVEKHCEDVPFDMEPYVDSAGHAYDFAFGMDWSGVIEDGRVRRFKK